MDVKLLSKMVLELAVDHDEIGMPGFGSFKAEIVPAFFSDKGYTINPPFRRLAFSQGETADASLVDFYAAQNGIKKEDSQSILESFFKDLTKQIVETKDVRVPGLGRFRAMSGGKLLFVCDPELNVYPDGFGLEPISLRNTRPDSSPDPQPSPRVEPVSAPASAPASEPEPAPAPAAGQADAPHPRRRALVAVLVILAVLLLAAAALRLMGTYFPELIDKILYTPEELQILYR
ncbi:MAG: hypothetical protein MJY43_05255 [Bacteroidales bacterium]|nr:hypothetical protein [Bacteroidales bacterium]